MKKLKRWKTDGINMFNELASPTIKVKNDGLKRWRKTMA